jgi:hypothetical protein
VGQYEVSAFTHYLSYRIDLNLPRRRGLKGVSDGMNRMIHMRTQARPVGGTQHG